MCAEPRLREQDPAMNVQFPTLNPKPAGNISDMYR